MVSRTRTSSLDINDGVNRKWLAIDLSSQQHIPTLKEALRDIAIDVCIYNVGVWVKAIRNLNDKEQRYMKDQDHKVSRAVVNFAKENNISVIRLEQLTNIRKTARTSRKNEKNLHNWSFYRLSQFIAYKANLVGIKVELVNPAYTSQTCPKCSAKNKAQDRKYKCKCGFEKHRDLVGAMNIRYAPVIDGKSQSA